MRFFPATLFREIPLIVLEFFVNLRGTCLGFLCEGFFGKLPQEWGTGFFYRGKATCPET